MHREPKRLSRWETDDSSRCRLLSVAMDTIHLKKLLHCSCYLLRMRLDGKVARIQEVNSGIRNILAKSLRSRWNEEWIVLAPDRQQRRLRLPEVLLKFGIELHVRCIVEKKIKLNLFVAGTLE